MENIIFQDITPEKEDTKRLQDEAWKKSIPAQVFLNHFFAISFLIRQYPDRYSKHNLPRFRRAGTGLISDMAKLKKLLLNAWSTEYALRSTAGLGDSEYLRYSLHWTFPQAFYSIFYGIRAYLYTQGLDVTRLESVSREFGKRVAAGDYPKCISFFADGNYNKFRLHHISGGHFRPGLQPASQEIEAAAEVTQFLSTTRKGQAWELRRHFQANPDTALRNQSGKVLEKFNADNWAHITRTLSNTTILDLMGRLRVSANHTEIERFVQADIDFALFHNSLCEIVAYLNFVHESYIAHAMGPDRYRLMVEALPPHLSKGFVGRRLEQYIQPLFSNMQNERPDIRIRA